MSYIVDVPTGKATHTIDMSIYRSRKVWIRPIQCEDCQDDWSTCPVKETCYYNEHDPQPYRLNDTDKVYWLSPTKPVVILRYSPYSDSTHLFDLLPEFISALVFHNYKKQRRAELIKLSQSIIRCKLDSSRDRVTNEILNLNFDDYMAVRSVMQVGTERQQEAIVRIHTAREVEQICDGIDTDEQVFVERCVNLRNRELLQPRNDLVLIMDNTRMMIDGF